MAVTLKVCCRKADCMAKQFTSKNDDELKSKLSGCFWDIFNIPDTESHTETKQKKRNFKLREREVAQSVNQLCCASMRNRNRSDMKRAW